MQVTVAPPWRSFCRRLPEELVCHTRNVTQSVSLSSEEPRNWRRRCNLGQELSAGLNAFVVLTPHPIVFGWVMMFRPLSPSKHLLGNIVMQENK